MALTLAVAAAAVAVIVICLRAAAGVIGAVTGFLRKFRPLVLFLAGAPMDGRHHTDATFLRGPTRILHPRGRLSPHWWHWRPGWHRGAIRAAAVLTALAVTAGLLADTIVTLSVLLAVIAAAAGVLARLAWPHLRHWKHEWHHVRPMARTLTARLGMRPANVEVAVDGGTVKSVAIAWTAEAEIGAQEKQAVLDAVTTRLAIEAPDETWELTGRNRSVVLTQSEPPPFPVSWEDVAAHVRLAEPGALVFGLGKRGAAVKASYGDSPHVAIPGGSGGGKSNLAAFLLLQEMLRGSLIFNLDPKWISHLWLQDLPNVISAHDVPDLHLALAWLGGELLRRTKAAYYSAAGTGRVRGNVGPRIIVLCEELNYGMDGLKDHWREIRDKDTDPRQSPAIGGLKAIATAGRASDMHGWLIAQLMTAASTGVSDSTIRTNCGITAMTRWDEPGWKMSVGKHIPMPPPTTTPGRIQLVTGAGPRETQVPYLHLDDKDTAVSDKAVAWARGLAVSGVVAQIPSGPEGVPPKLWPPCVLGQTEREITPGQEGDVVGQGPPAATLTLREAARQGMFTSLDAARKAVQRRALEPAGREGSAHLYYISELAGTARSSND